MTEAKRDTLGVALISLLLTGAFAYMARGHAKDGEDAGECESSTYSEKMGTITVRGDCGIVKDFAVGSSPIQHPSGITESRSGTGRIALSQEIRPIPPHHCFQEGPTYDTGPTAHLWHEVCE